MSKSPLPGDRIAKVIARAGRASRREAERLIEEGRVSVNGAIIDRAALNVTPKDRIEIDGVPLDAPEPPRLWLYHKPTGLVTTTRDEQGRPTIYDALPEDLPRVMSVGRLDLNSEGLLLLTNDGAVKRRLELPSTGWLRRYRVRLKGRPKDSDFDALREGITIDGENFQPMIVSLDRQQGANAWATVALREGKNREIRRAMEALGLSVNRLIRLSYGPFQLGNLKPGEVQEVRGRVLRDQLGLEGDTADAPGSEAPRKRPSGVTRRRAGAGAANPGEGHGRGPGGSRPHKAKPPALNDDKRGSSMADGSRGTRRKPGQQAGAPSGDRAAFASGPARPGRTKGEQSGPSTPTGSSKRPRPGKGKSEGVPATNGPTRDARGGSGRQSPRGPGAQKPRNDRGPRRD